jgi:hypothetical protein
LIFFLGLLFGFFGKRLASFGRQCPVLVGYFFHILAMVIAFMNLPFNSTIEDTNDKAFINPSNPELALFGSFLLGLGMDFSIYGQN